MQTKHRHKLLSILSSFLFSAFLLLCFFILFDTYATWRTKQAAQHLSVLKTMNSGSDDWSNGMLSINSDYSGWLNVIGTEISGPVVQSSSNNDYLRTDFYGKHSEAGTFFIDENVDLPSDGNIIIYGHLMNDGTMFADLKKYKSKEFFVDNNLVRWESESGVHYYQLFAGMVVAGDDTPLRTWINLQSPEQEAEMLDKIQQSAFFYQEDDLRTGPYLFLVTCDYQQKNGRLVLVASRI